MLARADDGTLSAVSGALCPLYYYTEKNPGAPRTPPLRCPSPWPGALACSPAGSGPTGHTTELLSLPPDPLGVWDLGPHWHPSAHQLPLALGGGSCAGGGGHLLRCTSCVRSPTLHIPSSCAGALLPGACRFAASAPSSPTAERKIRGPRF